ncbi:hypothetical protein BD309DRAFT_870522 [Dichomitus squalens]|uniref:Uncharacterized protein n=1 Tax=Dichomitus squalens TaxID=114155 RepID=A0A4Q9NIM2_9APHY|nr:hypothetical protein BD309DRAFT_870522 [Dichomitus squalens]TBU54107.1 hypothetical protein BD310DRAFT_828715 [Dichomitus squalens]
MSSNAVAVSPEEMSSLLTSGFCVCAVFAWLAYDWLLCFGEEIQLVWNWNSRRTGASLVYALSRYMLLLQNLLAVTSIVPMSTLRCAPYCPFMFLCASLMAELSCNAVAWMQTVTAVIGTFAPGIFSAMRAYALSGGNKYLSALAALLAIGPIVAQLVSSIQYQAVKNFPSPFNCSTVDRASPSLDWTLSLLSVTLAQRVPWIASDALVLATTWWFAYQSYRMQTGGIHGQSLSSILLYNGTYMNICSTSLALTSRP